VFYLFKVLHISDNPSIHPSNRSDDVPGPSLQISKRPDLVRSSDRALVKSIWTRQTARRHLRRCYQVPSLASLKCTSAFNDRRLHLPLGYWHRPLGLLMIFSLTVLHLPGTFISCLSDFNMTLCLPNSPIEYQLVLEHLVKWQSWNWPLYFDYCLLFISNLIFWVWIEMWKKLF